jgi:glycerophosphoryl diester phosphodiesterase
MTRVFAHRGDVARAPENTIAAFISAVEHGADGVELDVRRTRDGALVVHHDPDVAALGPISDLALLELPGHVALLDEALGVLEALDVNVEIKNSRTEPGHDPTGSISHDVAALLARRAGHERIVVSCFDVATLDAVRQADAELSTGLLLGWEDDAREGLRTAIAHGFGAIHPFVLNVDADLVDSAHAAGLDVRTWTVNARHDLERMVTIGVDVVITDALDLAIEVARAT